MQRFLPTAAAVALLLGVPAALVAQDEQPPTIDSIAVVGNQRLTASQIIGTSGLIAKQPVNYRDIQRAITALFRTGQFDDVLVEQQPFGNGLLLTLKVKERPVLERWAVRGVTAADVVDNGHGFYYLPARIPPDRITRLDPPEPAHPTTYHHGPRTAYQSSITVEFDDGTVLRGDQVREFIRDIEPRDRE